MSKTEILRQSAAAANEQRIAHLASQIEAVRQAKLNSAEELAEMLEPLAQAMAALTDETRETLAAVERQSRERGEQFQRQLQESTRIYRQAAEEAQKAASSLNRAGQRMAWWHCLMVSLVGMNAATLAIVFLLYLKPPAVTNHLDPKSVAEFLAPAVTEALKPSTSR